MGRRQGDTLRPRLDSAAGDSPASQSRRVFGVNERLTDRRQYTQAVGTREHKNTLARETRSTGRIKMSGLSRTGPDCGLTHTHSILSSSSLVFCTVCREGVVGSKGPYRE